MRYFRPNGDSQHIYAFIESESCLRGRAAVWVEKATATNIMTGERAYTDQYTLRALTFAPNEVTPITFSVTYIENSPARADAAAQKLADILIETQDASFLADWFTEAKRR